MKKTEKKAAEKKFKVYQGKQAQKSGAKRGEYREPVSYHGLLKAAGILGGLLLVLAAAAAFLWNYYRVDQVVVEGNLHYTQEEIEAIVMEGPLGQNSLFLSLKYRNQGIEDVPFVENMDVKVVSPHTIRIVVYEKAVAGYVEYLGNYMYFDKDGIVVEVSQTKTAGIPQVTGIDYDHVVLYEPLPVEEEAVFQQVLTITQVLNKYKVSADKIYFNDSNEVTLYFDGIKVRMGSLDNLEEKVMNLNYILEKLEGEKGVLDLESYSETNAHYSFRRDETESSAAASASS